MHLFKTVLLCLIMTIIYADLFAENSEKSTEITLKWQENRTVIIHIGDQSFPAQAGREQTISLPVDEALIVRVETPQATYIADNFLLVDNLEGAALTVWLDGSSIQFEYGAEGSVNRDSTPSRTETVAERSNSSENFQPKAEPRLQRNITVANMAVVVHETDPGIGLNVSLLDLAGYQSSLNEFRTENSSIFHSMAIDMNIGLYMLDEGPLSFNSMNYDLGLGYGAVFRNNIMAAATINLPIYTYTWTIFTTSTSVESNSDSHWFVTDAAYMRLQNSWSPFINSGGWHRGLSLNAAWDVALAGNGGSRFNIGIGISDFRLR